METSSRFREFSGRLVAALLDEMKHADQMCGNGKEENQRVMGFVEGLYRAECIALSIVMDMEREEQDNG